VSENPFAALGLPERPDLSDEQVRAAWRQIAAATHPDRPDGGDVARYTRASAAYAELRTPWGRSEAYADLVSGAGDTSPLPVVPGPAPAPRPVRFSWHPAAAGRLPGRIRHGRPLRLAVRALAAAWLCLAVLHLIPGQPAARGVVTGLITWFLLTGRSDLAPPPER
jgi:hypothetical protein